jgi:predicted nucleotidyltransferase
VRTVATSTAAHVARSGATAQEITVPNDSTLEEIVRHLVETLHPLRLYLFGSRARGDHRTDSDYDILLLVESKPTQRFALEQAAYKALENVPRQVGVDVVVMSRAYFEPRLALTASFPSTIVREGMLLYAA